MATQWIEQFSLLSAESQQQGLEQLVRSLNHTERTQLLAIISKQCDPLIRLPLELTIINLLPRLPLSSTWTLRRICKHWNTTLSSRDAVRAALQRWETHDPSDGVTRSSNERSDESRLKNMQAIKLGRPFAERTIANIDLPPRQAPSASERLDRCSAFKSHRFAYIPRSRGRNDSVIVHDLITDDIDTLHGEAREAIRLVALTSALVAFTSVDGWLYVHRFSDPAGQVHSARLPSAHVEAIGGDVNSIAVAMQRTNKGDKVVGEVLIYHADEQSLHFLWQREVRCSTQPGAYLVQSSSVVVDSGAQIVDVFALVEKDSGLMGPLTGETHCYVDHFRVHFDESAPGYSTADYHVAKMTRATKRYMFSPYPTGFDGLLSMTLFCKRIDSNKRPRSRRILFDQHSCTMREDENPDALQATNALWKGRLVKHASYPDAYACYINESFLIRLRANDADGELAYIDVSCFDSEVQLAGAVPNSDWHATPAPASPCSCRREDW